jgi:hypothetical protein
MVPETYSPKILTHRAKRLRRETSDNTYVTEEEIDRHLLAETVRIFIVRPSQLLFGELIVFLIAAYMSGFLYMFFVSKLHQKWH